MMADKRADRASEEHSDEEAAASAVATTNDAAAKHQRTHSPSPALVSASPPKFISFEALMQAADGVTNMKLAHEIAVDADFKFEKLQSEENSIHKQVQDVIHKAFWDSLEESLHDDPPEYSHALMLLKEVRETVLDLLLPQHQKMRAHIDEVLDMDLIRQKAEHGTLDVQYYAEFVTSVMSRLCAPVRDERITQIKQIHDIIPLFKEIFAMLDLMKMDMANFTVQQMRPYLQQQSVQYERTKFAQLLQQQQENNIDGLQYTKAWLKKSLEKLKAENMESNVDASAITMPTPAAILNEAYIELLTWNPENIFPETLLIDHSRFMDVRDKTKRLSLVSAILLMMFNSVASPLSSIQYFKEELKDKILIIIGDSDLSELGPLMCSICEQILTDVDQCLHKHGFPALTDTQKLAFRGQLNDITSPEHTLHKIIRSRVQGFIKNLLASTHTKDAKVPAGLSSVASELSHISGQFMRLVSYNRSVFGLYYADMIGALLQTLGDISPR